MASGLQLSRADLLEAYRRMRLIREGQRSDEIVRQIDEDRDIAVLVLAAGAGKEGPGPLVSTLVGKASGTFPIPIAVIPGTLTDDHIDGLA